MNELFCLDQFDPHEIISTLSAQGAISIPFLREDFRLILLQEARGYTYSLEPEVVGSGEELVRQQAASRCVVDEGSAFAMLRKAFQTVCDEAFQSLSPYPFTTRLRLTELRLQKYAPGSLGITPHRDGSRFCNLVCVLLVGGNGRFAVCADRSGRDARDLDTTPGRLLLLRAPGFLGSAERPFHYVTDIREERYTCALRQREAIKKVGWGMQ
jgi:hypothetical protein